MAQDLRTFIEFLEREYPGELRRIPEEVSSRYEATAVAVESERTGPGPALLFERVKGSSLRVLSNLFGSRRRYALGLGVEESQLFEALGRETRRFPPKVVSSGPVLEVVREGDAVDLGELPILTHFAEDAGPYLTAAITVAKDPDTGIRNASFHRMQVVGRNKIRTSLHSRRHLWDIARRASERNLPLPVSIVIGAHPLFYFGSGLWKGPIDVDEYEVAGGFFGRPLEVVPGRTVDVEAPADAEIVLEGVIDPVLREDEGPFGEFTGYASGGSTRHVVHLTAMLRRRDAIYQDIVSGDAAEHLTLLAVPQEARVLRALRQNFPTVRAVHYPASGTCRLHAYIAMHPTAEGQAKNLLLAAFGEDLSLKLVVVVDEDVDVTNEREVLWAVATRMQADRDLIVVPNAMGAILDPSSRAGVTAKLGIDATRPRPDFPPRLTLPEEALRRARAILSR